MNDRVTTAQVEALFDYRAVRIHWSRRVDMDDMRLAFERVAAILDTAQQPLHLVMDTQNNQSIPLMPLIQGLLNGPLAHPRLGTCLIVGLSGQARILAKTLGEMARDSDVQWFANDEIAFSHLRKLALPAD